MPNPINETRVLKLVFITIPCLKFWALGWRVVDICTLKKSSVKVVSVSFCKNVMQTVLLRLNLVCLVL